MTREQEKIIRELQLAIESFPAELAAGTVKSQKIAFDNIIRALSRLQLSPDGSVATTTANFALIDELVTQMQAAYLNPQYVDFLQNYIGGFDIMAEMTVRLFETFGVVPDINAAISAIFENSKKNALQILTQGAVDTAIPSFREILNNAVARAEKFTDVIRNIRQNIEGSEDFQGRMERYAKQNAKDIFSVGHGQYMAAIGESLGFEFWEYAGVLVTDSREFCIQRQNKIFHTREVRDWASLSWEGKNRATTADTIFSLRGGYNCNHLLVPVPTELVPEDVIARAKEKGYYKG